MDQYRWLQSMVMALKYIREADISPYLMTLLKGLSEVAEEPGIQGYLKVLLKANVADADQLIIDIESELPPTLGKTAMTIADQLVEKGQKLGLEQGRQEGRLEGKQEGRQEGRQESKIETVILMHQEGIELDLIVRVTGLSKDQIEMLVRAENDD